ncbi:HNH endonuclease signature motif containing protein [Pseudactinotalea sp. HY158]|uniref:HNH endonuclease signature motif containing protein n=1 Tax=Pseudactinotalea sp. HY158 TaxID=2654547 RepID=UPI00129C9438|nr:HNH endonuclease signature motif containing protein [Pseudactinotalea sp. HY158]QGH68827.1 hypothetical protein GCE65_04435 [Pseudactinotalea sp. HY158]
MAAAAAVDLTPDEAAGQFAGPITSTAAAPATSTAAGPAGSTAVGSAGSTAVGSAAGAAVAGAAAAGAAADATGGAPATAAGGGVSCGPAWSGRGVPRAKVVMYLHMNASAFWPDGRPPDRPDWHSGNRPPDRHPGDRPPDHPARDPGCLLAGGSCADPPGSATSADTTCPEHAAGPACPEHATGPAYVAGRLAREPVRIEGPGTPPGLVVSAAEVAAMFTTPHGAATPDSAPVDGPRGSDRPRGTGGPWGPQIFVRPVIDLETEHEVAGYAAGDVIKDHLHLRDRTCVFPNCARPARACDADHIDPWKTDRQGDLTGGPTCTCNLASLCRRHHRWKTHNHPGQPQGRGSWSYVTLAPGTYYWSGPMGLRFLRTPTGTSEVTDQAWHRRDLAALQGLQGRGASQSLEALQGAGALQDLEALTGSDALPGRESRPDRLDRLDRPDHRTLPGNETLPGLEKVPSSKARPDSRARRDDLDEAFMDALDYEYGNDIETDDGGDADNDSDIDNAGDTDDGEPVDGRVAAVQSDRPPQPPVT